MASIDLTGLPKILRGYAYDKNGNRTVEAYYKSGTSPIFYQTASIQYDALNRVTRYIDAEANISYAYDANSNRRQIKTAYSYPGMPDQVQDYWYKYDKMNRYALTKGTLNTTTNVIEASNSSVSIVYNTRGDRLSATFGRDGHVEEYTYSPDGYVETISLRATAAAASVLRVTRKNDILGRTTLYTEYQSTGATLLTRSMTYDVVNRVTDETDTMTAVVGGVTKTTTNVIHNDYKLQTGSTYTGTDIGVVTHTSNAQTQTGSSTTTTQTAFTYVWWGGAKTLTSTVSGTTTGTGTYTYDVNGFLTEFNDTAVNRKVTYQNDVYGQVVTRQEYNSSLAGVRRNFFYLNGHVVGDRGTDMLASQIDYAEQLLNDNSAAVNAFNGIYGNPATPVVSANAHFDTYEAYNPTVIDQAGSSYTVNDGDTYSADFDKVGTDLIPVKHSLLLSRPSVT